MGAGEQNNEGVELYEHGRLQEARRAFEEALTSDPLLLVAVKNLAVLEWGQSRITDLEFIIRLRALESAHGDEPDYWRVIGEVHFRRGDMRAAVDCFEKSLSLGNADGVREFLQQARESVRHSAGPCLKKILDDHIGAVRAVWFDGDGRIASVGQDGMVKLWESATGECVRSVSLEVSEPRLVAPLPSGDRVLVIGTDGVLYSCKLADGKARLMSGSFDSACSLSVSPDGRSALVAMATGEIQFVDLGGGSIVRALRVGDSGLRFAVPGPAFRIVLAGDSAGFGMWDLDKESMVEKYAGHADDVITAVMSHDGSLVLSGSLDKTMRLWEAATGRCLRIFAGHTMPVSLPAISPDRKRGLSSSADMTVRIWDLEFGTCLRTLEGHESAVTSLAVSPDGKMAVSGGGDGRVLVWNVESAGLGIELPAFERAEVKGRASLEDSKMLSASLADQVRQALDQGRTREALDSLRRARAIDSKERDPGLLLLWRFASLRASRVGLTGGWAVRRFIGHFNSVTFVGFHHDGRTAVSAGLDKTMHTWDLESGDHRYVYKSPFPVQCAALIADGHDVVVGGQGLAMLDSSSGKVTEIVSSDSSGQKQAAGSSDILAVAASVDGGLAVCGQGPLIRILDLSRLEFLPSLEEHTDTVRTLTISRDSRFLLSGGDDRGLRLWDLRARSCLRNIPDHDSAVTCAALSPDGMTALAGTGSGSILLYDLAAGVRLAHMEGHGGAVNSVDFSSDGRFAVSAGADRTLRVWDLASGRCLIVLLGHTGVVHTASFSADGNFIISGGGDDTVRQWFLDWDLDADAKPPGLAESYNLEASSLAAAYGLKEDAPSRDSGPRDASARGGSRGEDDDGAISSDELMKRPGNPDGEKDRHGEKGGNEDDGFQLACPFSFPDGFSAHDIYQGEDTEIEKKPWREILPGLDAFAREGSGGLMRNLDGLMIEAPELPGFQRLEAAGEWGFGRIFQGLHQPTGKKAIIRLIDKAVDGGLELSVRLERAAAMLGEVRHAHLAEFFGHGHLGERLYFFAMEEVEGSDFFELVRSQGRVALKDAAMSMLQCLDAISCLHENNVVHREIGPASLVVSGPQGKWMAKVRGFEWPPRPAPDGRTPGSEMKPAEASVFSPPEWLAARPSFKPSGDVFGAGACFYYLLTGSFIHELSNRSRIMAMLDDNPVPLCKRAPEIPRPAAAVIDRSVMKNPEDRFTNASEMMEALMRAL